jgi:hypothetical protein
MVAPKLQRSIPKSPFAGKAVKIPMTRRLNPDGSAAVRHGKSAAQPSGMDIVALLGDNFADRMRQVPRPRRLNEFDPEYAR